MSRDMSYRRRMRNKHIERKKKIITHSMYDTGDLLENERFIGKLDKGKVHCSCPLCREKTREIGYKASERRKIKDIGY